MRKRLPPNASAGHRQLAEILEKMLNSNGACMTILYEYSLEDLGNVGDADYYDVKGMSVDFYIKELDLAIEYQGQQHYKDSGFFSGQQGRDLRKKDFLEDMGIRLVEIPDDGKQLSMEAVRRYIGV